MPSVSLIFRDDDLTGSVTMEFVPDSPVDFSKPGELSPAQRVASTAAALLSDAFVNRVAPVPTPPPDAGSVEPN